MGTRELATPEELGRALARAPDPEQARVALSRLGDLAGAHEALGRADVLEAAIPLLGFAQAAVDFFVRHPDELAMLADMRPREPEDLRDEAATSVAEFGPRTGLRRFRRRATYRLAARDLLGEPVDDVIRELSSIAEALLVAALDASEGAERIAVIGMGKLGGRELNYSSDVDVIFVHKGAAPEDNEEANNAAAAIIALLSDPTDDGIAIRVDPNLRPDGRAGPLSRSLASMEDHYDRHAATWEKQALLKARPVAGDLALGGAFIEAVTPFVYPDVLSPQAVEDVRATKARIEEIVRAQGKEDREVKRGRGGIRDVEFAVQLLQLVHGRRHPELRQAGTLPALGALAEAGFVSVADADALGNSYRFLRRLEHRLQMVRDLQTHELPSNPRQLETLARAMGLDGINELRAEHARHAALVREAHERLFYRPLLEAFAHPGVPEPGADRADAEELLAGLGFAEPSAAYMAFERVVDPSTRLGRVLGGLFPVIAPALADADRPDAALARLERVAGELARAKDMKVAVAPNSDAIADRLAERPDAARRLASLLAQSSAFADRMVARPELVMATFELPAPERPLFASDPEADLVRVAAAYASREVRVPELGRRLAAVADGVTERAIGQNDGGAAFAAIGLGSFGREELSFASDLDLVFVFEGDTPDEARTAMDRAEATIGRVKDAGWQIDAALRPEGRSGPVARSMASYLEYWSRWADTWEYQALLGARFVAGDEALGRRFVSNARDFAFPEVLNIEQVAAIRRMRVRMEEERVRPPEARRFHFKLGYGGLADVQFAVELSLMRHGAAHRDVQCRKHPLEALEALAAERLIEQSVALSLSEAYTFLMEIRAALEIDRRLPADALPPQPEAQAALARRLGYGERSRQRFLEDYRRITRRARLAMERVFYEEAT
jgi:[glutamine synthetase] adenylyltransferase / [glutamine synthetase]-adenylyl-L-tyrosine phosphorylase